MRPWESHCKLKLHEHQILQSIFQYPVKFKIIQNVLGIPGSDHHHRPKIQGLSLNGCESFTFKYFFWDELHEILIKLLLKQK